jgi:hypothetical protein
MSGIYASLNNEEREMSESMTPTRFAAGDRRTPRIGTETVKPGAAVPKSADKTSGRHAAITDTLNNWSSYKKWVEKMRGTWEERK